MNKTLLIIIALFAFLTINANAQFKNYNIKGGIMYDQLIPTSEYNSTYSFIGRGFVGFEITNNLCLQISAGYGQYGTTNNYNPVTGTYDAFGDEDENVYQGDLKATIIPIDARLKIAPWAKTAKDWNPYFYVGAGAMNYNVKSDPDTINYNIDGWTGIFPAGIGTEIKMSKNVMLDFNIGYTYTTTDLLNNFVVPDFTDGMANVSLGLTFAGGDDCNTDYDKDGLTKCKEEQIGTNPEIADTDGDGCLDGEEVNVYKTDPLNKDSDGDSLLDCDEIKMYSTNPLNKDTDGDRLMDNEEINTYNTLPTDSDTDDDGLTDGAEVLDHKTDPKMVDTDLGSIGDGVEVNRGSDPLNPADDLPPPPPEEKVKVGEVITLEGINFATNSHTITSLSEDNLELALSALRDNPNMTVEISGHTDNTGTRNWNMELSLLRANSVKDWFVSKGIDASRITTVGYGPDKPIAPNDTEQGRYENRRIDFERTK